MPNPILLALRDTLLTRAPLDALPAGVWKRTGALNTWGTNAIEGNTLSREEVERVLLKERSVAGRPLRDLLETVQHEQAFEGLLDRRDAPVRAGTARELHEAVFRGIAPDAGQWRRMNVRIAGMSHVPPRMELVSARMAEWEEDYGERDVGGEDVFRLGAWMHFGFEAIHPFSDGNGRVGRLLLNLHFLKHNWPPVHILPPDRARYLRALDAGHSGEFGGLEGFLEAAMGRSLLDLLDQVGVAEDELRPLRRLAARGPYSAKYLGLRASQERLPAVKVSGDWMSSPRALRLYREFLREGPRPREVARIRRRTSRRGPRT